MRLRLFRYHGRSPRPRPQTVATVPIITPSSHAGSIYADAPAVEIDLEAQGEPEMMLLPQTGLPFCFPWVVASRSGFVPGIRPGGNASTRHRRSTQRKRSASSPVGRSTTGNGCCCPPLTQASLADTKSSLLHFRARRARLHCLREGR